MTFKLRTRALTAIAMGGLLVAAGCSSLKVNVIRDHAITITPRSKCAWSPAQA